MAKLNFQQHYSSLQCHMILQKSRILQKLILKQQCCLIFLWILYIYLLYILGFFDQSFKEQHLFWIEIFFWNIWHKSLLSTVTFDLFNAFLLKNVLISLKNARPQTFDSSLLFHTTIQNAIYLPQRTHNSKPESCFCKFHCSRCRREKRLNLSVCVHVFILCAGPLDEIEKKRANNFDVSHVAARWFHVLSWEWLFTSFVMINWTRLSTTPSRSYCDTDKFILFGSFSRQLFDIIGSWTGKLCMFGFV